MKLTSKNYFTAKNNHISNSDKNNYKKCKNYFYRKKVLRDLPFKVLADVLITGSAVDEWLTKSEASFRKKYKVTNRSKTEDQETYRYKLTQGMYNEIVGMCKSVEASEAYKLIKKEKHKSQKILQWDFPINEYFDGICNIPDWYIIDKKTGICTITDLKTAKAFGGSKIKWHYKCLDYNYYTQQAMAQKILKHDHPEIKFFQSRHLIVEKDPDGIHNVYAWIISQDRIDDAMIELNETLEDIHNEINFNKLPASWSDDDVVGEYEE